MQTNGWKPRVLLAEDDSGMRAVMRFNLEELGFAVTEAKNGDEALALLGDPAKTQDKTATPFELILTDLKMPGVDGMEVLRQARRRFPAIQVVIVTAFGTVEHAMEAMEAGAADYVTKPFQRAEFKTRISGVLQRLALQRENEALREQVSSRKDPHLITESPRMREVLRMVERVAASDTILLLCGESGTGKEVFARAIHLQSPRAGGPFIPVNCAALPANLLESELFGYERGAFTGADRTHIGKFERAKGGTLFLDEIGELPLSLQAKLLRVLEEGIVDRLGGRERVPVDARVVLASNRNLREEVSQGRFREDLYHRINVIPITLPPLRERLEDIPILVRQFLDRLGGAGQLSVAPSLLAELSKRPWPGNIRELRNLVERMVLLRRSDVLDLVDLAVPGTLSGNRPRHAEDREQAFEPAPSRTGEPSSTDVLHPGRIVLPEIPFSLIDLEQEIIHKAIQKHQGNRSAAARYLGIPRHVLIYRLEKYHLDKPSPDDL